jgi:hypothetical protein
VISQFFPLSVGNVQLQAQAAASSAGSDKVTKVVDMISAVSAA